MGVEGGNLEVVNEFVYLGVLIDKNGRCRKIVRCKNEKLEVQY